MPPLWIGTGNYDALLSNPKVWRSFAVTGTYAVLSVGFQAIIGFGLALLLRAKFKASGLLTTLILIPMMLSPVVVGQFWKLIFDPTYGIFNYIVGLREPDHCAGHAPGPCADRGGHRRRLDVEPVCHVALSVRPQGDSGLHLRGGSRRPGQRVAASSGASRCRRSRPLLTLAVLFRTIEALKAFDLVMGLTGGGPGNSTEVVSISLYRMVFQGQARTGEASALAYIMLIVIIGISNVYIWYLNRMKES